MNEQLKLPLIFEKEPTGEQLELNLLIPEFPASYTTACAVSVICSVTDLTGWSSYGARSRVVKLW